MSKRSTEEKLLKANAHVFTGTTQNIDSVWKNVQMQGDGQKRDHTKPRDEHFHAVISCLLQE